ncbi:MAG: phage tail tape measure protein, partial [Actinobacteria bacterium]|nr:phage tail tape measure protein [Actinomycetota bacterium]
SEQVMATLANFGLPRTGAGASRIANLFAASIGASPFTMQRLQYFMQYAGPLAASAGMSPERAIAMGGVLMQRGLPAEMAGTGFRQMVNALLTPEAKSGRILEGLGLDAQEVARQVGGGNLLGVLEQLNRRGISLADTFQLFGAEAGNAANILIHAGAPAVLALERQITGTNRAFEMQREQVNTVAGQWAILKSTVQGLEIQFGRGLEPALTATLGALNRITGAWFQSGIAQRMGGAAGGILSAILGRVEEWVGGGGIDRLWERLVSGGRKAWAFLSDLYTAVKQWFRPEMLQWYGQMWEWLKKVIGEAGDTISAKLGLQGGGWMEVLAHIPEYLGRGFSWLWQQFPKLVYFGIELGYVFAEVGVTLGFLGRQISGIVAVWDRKQAKTIAESSDAVAIWSLRTADRLGRMGGQAIALWQQTPGPPLDPALASSVAGAGASGGTLTRGGRTLAPVPVQIVGPVDARYSGFGRGHMEQQLGAQHAMPYGGP